MTQNGTVNIQFVFDTSEANELVENFSPIEKELYKKLPLYDCFLEINDTATADAFSAEEIKASESIVELGFTIENDNLRYFPAYSGIEHGERINPPEPEEIDGLLEEEDIIRIVTSAFNRYGYDVSPYDVEIELDTVDTVLDNYKDGDYGYEEY